jgi:hypothetical protein
LLRCQFDTRAERSGGRPHTLVARDRALSYVRSDEMALAFGDEHTQTKILAALSLVHSYPCGVIQAQAKPLSAVAKNGTNTLAERHTLP